MIRGLRCGKIYKGFINRIKGMAWIMTDDLFYKLVDGNQAKARKVIARCHSPKHQGFLTERLLKSHDCATKKCPHLEKTNQVYWYIHEKAMKPIKESKQELKQEKRQLENEKTRRDSYIKTVLQYSGCIYVTSIRESRKDFLEISYIYDRIIDLTPEINMLRKRLDITIKLDAAPSADEIKERLIKQPRRDSRKTTDVRKAPKVGNATRKRLKALGISCLEDLYGQSAESLYWTDCKKANTRVSRRFLTAYRSAVEYAYSIKV